MAKYRRKPEYIEVVQWTGDNVDEIRAFAGDANVLYSASNPRLAIMLSDGYIDFAEPHEWIVKNAAGQLFVWKGDYFAEEYEPVDSEDAE